MPRHRLVEAAACKSKVEKFTVVRYIRLPEGEDDDDAVGGDAHVAADEAAGEPEVVRVVDVVGDGSDDLHAVVDETDHCQHDPGHQQASLALW